MFGQLPIFSKVQIADFTFDPACLVNHLDVFLAMIKFVKLFVAKIALVAVLRHFM